MKKLMCALIVFVTLFMFCPKDINVYASGGETIMDFGSFANNTETIIQGGIIKKEMWSCRKTESEGNVKDDCYRYVTMRLDITYTNRRGKKIATAYLESNFRYNTKYKEAKCLSVAHGEQIIDRSYEIDGFSRRKNCTWSHGAAYGKVSLFKGKTINQDKYILNCDYNGHLKLVKILGT